MKQVLIVGNPTDEEAAACMAAIYAVCRSEEQQITEETPELVKSAWGRAALLENAVRLPVICEGRSTQQRSLWSLAGRLSRTLVVVLLLGLVCGASLSPCFAYERIQPVDNLRQDMDTAGEQQKRRHFIRVSLGNLPAAEISMPDGAEIFDAETAALVAKLPPRSSWSVCNRFVAGSRKICFAGTLGNKAFSKVIVNRSQGDYSDASYQYKAQGFRPKVLDSESPVFSVELRPASNKDSGYRPVAFAPAPLHSLSPDNVPAPPTLRGLVVRPARPDGILGLGNRSYRGCFLVRPSSRVDHLSVVNLVELEDYLLSVVPSEMPGCWPLEALKAQAVAARSFAIANFGKHGSEGFDVTATVEDQVYNGIQSETENSNRAVGETSGLVLKHGNSVVSAFFHSSGGGCTELAEHVWGKPVPYLKCVADYDDSSPHFAWTRQFSVASAEEALKKAGKDIGSLLGMFPLVRTSSGRLKTAMLFGSKDVLLVSGEELRKIFTLPSSLFNAKADNDAYIFAGRGHGHGLGMSQWGAKTLAEQGYNAAQILSYYYKDVSIEQQ